ncbi:MAG: ATPase, T2SS/T4P/T4SS family, partial [Bdellovibrionales bacterium]
MSSTDPQIIFSYLMAMKDHQASDLYLTVGRPPTLRTENAFLTIKDKSLIPDEINEILNTILTTRQRREFERTRELNSALDMRQFGRFRVNVLQQRQFPALVIRSITSKIPNFEELKLPPIFAEFAMERRGLVLLTGMTGSGKSTSLAAMVDHRNQSEDGHIITIEDPIEF